MVEVPAMVVMRFAFAAALGAAAAAPGCYRSFVSESEGPADGAEADGSADPDLPVGSDAEDEGVPDDVPADELEEDASATDAEDAGDGDTADCIPYDPSLPCAPNDCACIYADQPPEMAIARYEVLALFRVLPDVPREDPPDTRLRRDGSELLIVIRWYDGGYGFCAYHCTSSNYEFVFVLDAESGAILLSRAVDSIGHPENIWNQWMWDNLWGDEIFPSLCRPGLETLDELSCATVSDRLSEWRMSPGCRDGPGWWRCCEAPFPELDLRFSTMDWCFLHMTYPGFRDGLLYGVIQRNRISTGEWLAPVDLPILVPE